jgi:hypothetical protein
LCVGSAAVEGAASGAAGGSAVAVIVERNVDRLRGWHCELRSGDFFDSVPIGETQRQLDACVTVLDRFTTLVYTAVGLD